MSEMTNSQLMGLNDEDFMEAMRRERPVVIEMSRASLNHCDCDVCDRLWRILLERPETPIEVKVDTARGRDRTAIIGRLAPGDVLTKEKLDRMLEAVFGMPPASWRDLGAFGTGVWFEEPDGSKRYVPLQDVRFEVPPNSVTGGQDFALDEFPSGIDARVPYSPTDQERATAQPVRRKSDFYDGMEAAPIPGHPPIEMVEPAPDWAVLRLPTDSAERKRIPLGTGLIDYFPDALAEVAKVSQYGNDKHNPGEPMHHARGKSMDHEDCLMRHYVDRYGVDPASGLDEAAFMCWRALAFYQELLERRSGLTLPRGARPA